MSSPAMTSSPPASARLAGLLEVLGSDPGVRDVVAAAGRDAAVEGPTGLRPVLAAALATAPDAGGAPEMAASDDAAGEEGSDEAADGSAGAGDDFGGAAADEERATEEVDLLTPLGEVTLASFRDAALEAAAADAGVEVRTEQAGLDQEGAAHCWQVGTDRQDWPRRHAAEASLDGEPVVVLVGQEGDARGIAVLLPRSCTTGAPVEALDTVTWGS